MGKYKVITLCGSTKFKEQYLEAQKRLTLEGNIVISVGLFGHSGDDEVWTEGTKAMLDDMHKRKIDMADEIFVINVGGYIGESTRNEIAYAKSQGIGVRYLENSKISIRFFNDREVRAIWDEANSKLNTDGVQLVSVTHDFKFEAPDGKKRAADALDNECVEILAKHYPNNRANAFLDWFTYSDNTIDGQSKKKAYTFMESNIIADGDIGTVKALQQIHAYIFGGLYDFAGQIRTKTISKRGFTFCLAEYLPHELQKIESMPEDTFDQIVAKYVEMNVAHPFMEGNGRSTRIWLDLILKKRLQLCIDWSKINKNDYLNAMIISHTKSDRIKELLASALTDKINDRETFMKGIDYSYYYEQED